MSRGFRGSERALDGSEQPRLGWWLLRVRPSAGALPRLVAHDDAS